ncbi:hypothetical protein V2J09_003661 [Rumex salicifolius]
MAAFLFISLFLGMAGYTSAAYCVCKDGVGDTYLQKNIDYACGNGADCTAIIQNGACYQPNTLKAHCDYAVNNYYQKKGQVTGSCDFSGSATVTATLPSTVASGCTYAASSSQVNGTPTTAGTSTTTTTGTPTTTTGTTTYGMGPTGIDSSGIYSYSSRGHSVSLAVMGILLVGASGFQHLFEEGMRIILEREQMDNRTWPPVSRASLLSTHPTQQ